ncbi:DNA polymerase III subunit gamma/tau [Deferrisoma sp.]
MAYQVLARKWRPQRFAELRGQAHIVRALTNALKAGRIAHAYLFTGIRGVGKTSAARILAKALNCPRATPDPCNACPSCVEITQGRSPDVLEIDGASNTGVDDVRRLREAVRYPPQQGRFRVYIIDEVHMLSTAAFNALLKTLEEPPEHAVFVFATTDPHKVPATILSRCQQFDFRRLDRRELMGLLGDVVKAEGIEAEPAALAAIAREADGSVRDAQSLLDQVIAYAGDRISYEAVRDVLGVVDRELLFGLAERILGRDAGGVLGLVAEARRVGVDVGRLAQDLLELFRDLAVLRAVEKAEGVVDLPPEERAEAGRLVEGHAWEVIHARFDMLARSVEGVRLAAEPWTVLEMTLLKLALLPPLVRISDVASGAARGQGGASAPARTERARRPTTEGSPARPSRREESAAPDPGGVPAGSGEERKPAAEEPGPDGDGEGVPAERPPASPPDAWERFLGAVRESNRALWNVLREHARFRRWDPEARRVHLATDREQLFFFRSKADVLGRAAARVWGAGAAVDWVVDEPAPRGRAGGSDLARQVRKETLEHPLVRGAMEIFDATVEEVKVLKR